MAKPQVNIEVNEQTGRWSVDALPMILMPQHFFLNNYRAVDAALGTPKHLEVLRPAGYRSAYFWCQEEAKHHGLSGLDVFLHYMKRITQRGWGQFKVVEVDEAAGTGVVELRNSVFVDSGHQAVTPQCGMFASWLEGSLEYVAEAAGRPRKLVAAEVYCAADGVHDHCRFEVKPA